MTWSPPSETPPDVETGRVAPWMVSLADLVSLLLSFTILIFAHAQLEGEEWSEAARSIRAAFGGPAWMNPDRTVRPSVELAPALPTLDLGYLAQVVEQRLGSGTEPTQARLESNRLRLVPPSPASVAGRQDGHRDQSPLGQLSEILARVGNAVIIDVRVPAASTAAGAPVEAEWRAALLEGSRVAASLIEGGVTPNRLAVLAAAAGSATATPVRSVVEIVVLDHGGQP
jgi:Flagellar motor protein